MGSVKMNTVFDNDFDSSDYSPFGDGTINE